MTKVALAGLVCTVASGVPPAATGEDGSKLGSHIFESLPKTLSGAEQQRRERKGRPEEASHSRISLDLLRQRANWGDEREMMSLTGEPQHAGRVSVDVIFDTVSENAVAELKQLRGVIVRHISRKYHRASLIVHDLGILDAVAEIEGVQRVQRQHGPITQSVTPRRSDQALAADTLASMTPHLTGDGQTVGILSDSFARTFNDSNDEVADGVREIGTFPDPCEPGTLTGAQNQDSGDLPSEIELVADDAAANGDCPVAEEADPVLSDEGAAMAELVHHIAPDADIAFHTAFSGFGAFAEGIDALCDPDHAANIGADVVVDDVIYLTDSLMYQSDAVSQAAAACVDRGTPYLSSAGNFSDRAFRQEFEISTEEEGTPDLHAWSEDSDAVGIALAPGAALSVVLQWNQPALSSPENDDNGPQVDLSLALFEVDDDENLILVAASNEDQQADQPTKGADPVESLGFVNESEDTQGYVLVVALEDGDAGGIPQHEDTPLEFRLLFPFSQDEGVAIEYLDTDSEEAGAPQPGPSLYGQSAEPGVIGTAAVGWYQAPSWNPAELGTEDVDPQPFSAKGGELPRHFAADGTFIGETTPLKPDLAAVDEDNTTFFGSTETATSQDTERDKWPNFAGTSAAAPTAAAVVALLQEYADEVEPAAMLDVLQDTAFDVVGERAQEGPDDVTGYGLIDAASALSRFPEANAGDDDAVEGGEQVELDGSASVATRDAEETAETIDAYAWQETSGQGVDLDGANEDVASFTAPDEDVVLTFELVVTNERALTHADTVAITVSASDESDDDGSEDNDSGGDEGSGDDSSEDNDSGGNGGSDSSATGLFMLAAFAMLAVWRRLALQAGMSTRSRTGKSLI